LTEHEVARLDDLLASDDEAADVDEQGAVDQSLGDVVGTDELDAHRALAGRFLAAVDPPLRILGARLRAIELGSSFAELIDARERAARERPQTDET
jgi:hypothetical protein